MRSSKRNQKWYDKPLVDSYIRPSLEFLGSGGGAGLAIGAASFPIWYLITRKMGFEDSARRSALLSAITGGATWAATRAPDLSKEEWANQFLPQYARKNSSIFHKTFNKNSLRRAVDEIPGFTHTQKTFLNHGIDNATIAGNQRQTTLEGLADGFTSSTGAVTGGKLGYVTRAIEGAVIGSAFSSLAGLSPGTSKWVTGLTAAADSLYGNRLVNTLGYFD